MDKLTIDHRFYIRSVIDTCLQTLQVLAIGAPIVWVLLSIMLGLLQPQVVVEEATNETTGISARDSELMGAFFCGFLLVSILLIFVVYFFSVVGHLRAIHKKVTELEDKVIGDTVHKLTV